MKNNLLSEILSKNKMVKKLKIALVTPHIFMWDTILAENIFAPGHLAVDLADGLTEKGHSVTLFTTGPVKTKAKVISVNLNSIQNELKKHKLNLTQLIKDDLETFHKLFKIIELEILSNVFSEAKHFDLVHIYITSGPEGPIFSRLIDTPILFTLHDPFKLAFPNPESYKFIKNVKFTAISNSQKSHVPKLNIIKTIYNGIETSRFKFINNQQDYFIYFGRIIKPKGVHHAINVCIKSRSELKIAGLFYEGHGGDTYWSRQIKPLIDNKQISYKGFLKTQKEKNRFLGNAKALLFPIEWEEPFGLAIIEANACGTPVIAFNRGSVSEIIKDGINGYIVKNEKEMLKAMKEVDKIDRRKCQEYAAKTFSLKKMINRYESCYKQILLEF